MYNLGSIGLVVLVLVAVRCSGAFFFDDECGGEPYDKETEICCDDVKYEKGPYDRCCSGTMIDSRVSYCSIHMVFHYWGKGCNGVYYEKDEQLCCGGKLTAYDPNIECCSGDLMDKRASRCSWGMIVNNDETGCDNVYYKKEEQICCNKKLHPKTEYTECCSGEIFDNRASVCMWGIVINTRVGCAGKYFDKDTEFCCADQVHTKDSIHSCCGGKTVYDPTKFTCEVAGYTLPM